MYFKLLSAFSEFCAKQVSKKSKATKQRMINENKHTSWFSPKYSYDDDEYSYLAPCKITICSD